MKLCGKGLHDLDAPTVSYTRSSDGRRRCGLCGRARGRQWREANLNRDHIRTRAVTRKWRAANPTLARAGARKSRALRRACIANVLATLTATEWEIILAAAGYTCIYCGSQETLTQDHLIPISSGGNHTAENVAPACLPCNQSKGAKTVEEFLAEAA